MDVIFHPAHAMNENPELLGDAGHVGPLSRLEIPLDGLAPSFGANPT